MKLCLISICIALIFLSPSTSNAIILETVSIDFVKSSESSKEESLLISSSKSQILLFDTLQLSDVLLIVIDLHTNATGSLVLELRAGETLNDIKNSLNTIDVILKRKIRPDDAYNKLVYMYQVTPNTILKFGKQSTSVSVGLYAYFLNGETKVANLTFSIMYSIGSYDESTFPSEPLNSSSRIIEIHGINHPEFVFLGSILYSEKIGAYDLVFPDILDGYVMDVQLTYNYEPLENKGSITKPKVSFAFNEKSIRQSVDDQGKYSIAIPNVNINKRNYMTIEAEGPSAKIQIQSIELQYYKGSSYDRTAPWDFLFQARGNSPALGLFIMTVSWGTYFRTSQKRINAKLRRLK